MIGMSLGLNDHTVTTVSEFTFKYVTPVSTFVFTLHDHLWGGAWGVAAISILIFIVESCLCSANNNNVPPLFIFLYGELW